MTSTNKINKKLVILPTKQYVNRSEGGNIWSLNLHSTHTSEWLLHNKFSTHKTHDTGLTGLRVLDREIGKDLHPFKSGVPFKKKFCLKNIKDNILTAHIKGVRVLNA